MIKINLLPVERQKTEVPFWKLYRILAYVFLGLTILFWAYNLASYKYLDYQIEDVDKQLATQQVWQQRYEKSLRDNTEINKRRNLINGFKKGRTVWSHFLAQLGNVTPPNCWVESISQTVDKQGDVLTIKGAAANMDSALDYLSVLNTLPGVTAAQLTDTTAGKKNNMDVLNYTILLQRSTADGKKPKTDAKPNTGSGVGK